MPEATAVLETNHAVRPARSGGDIRWMYALFFLSGISGLMYEVVWVRMLTRVLGSTVYATSTVLAAFMAGLVLGSFLAGRFIDRVRRPLGWYACLELGIGLSALATLALPDRLLPLYQAIYDFGGDSRAWLRFGQVVIALVVLLAPTALMGATLPALSVQGARHRADFGQFVGTLYGLNTLGALAGVLASGFVLIGEIGETRTILLGVLLNLLVGAAAVVLAGRAVGPPGDGAGPGGAEPADGISDAGLPPLYRSRLRPVLLACFAVSGFVALANEVVWGRMLILHQGTSIYAFSSMLAVVLAGMGLGSFVGGKWVSRFQDPLRQLARLQIACGLFQVVALHLYDREWTGWFLAPLVLVGPLGLVWGLAFPVGARCYTRSLSTAGRSIAELYSWNTLGCIAGSLVGGFVLIPLLGNSRSIVCLAAVSAFLGLALLGSHPDGLCRVRWWPEWGLAAACAVLLATAGDPYYRQILRVINNHYPAGVVLYRHVEEAGATTTAFGKAGGGPRDKQLWVNGQGMTALADVTKLMAHLPIALADNPRDALIICFGMGTTARSASRHEGLEVHIVELVPAVLQCFGYYHADGPEVLARPTVHATADDGRNYLLMHRQPYDVITIDPAPPLYSAGTVNLYSREFFRLCRERLRPGGVVCLWVPPDRLSEVKMIMRTFLDVFENVDAWSGTRDHPGFLLIGSRRRLQDVAEKIRRLYRDPAVVADLREWGNELDRPEKILGLYVANDQRLRQSVAGASVITDDRPYTEFYLWRRLNRHSEYHTITRAVPAQTALPPAEYRR